VAGWFSNALKALLFTLLLLGVAPHSAQAVTKKIPGSVRVTPIERDGQILNLVEVGDLPSFALVDPTEDERGLTQEQKQELSETRRDILRKTLVGLVYASGESPVLVTENSVVVEDLKATRSEVDVVDNFQKAVNSQSWTGDITEEIAGYRRLRERAAAVIAFVWEAVVGSTIRTGKEFYEDGRHTKGYKEFGFTVVIRGEFQVGMGNINMMKNVARGVDVGFDFATKELVLRKVVRTESMDGGVALSTGPKIELRGYRASLEAQDKIENGHHIHGKSWYPPAIPGVSFAAEKFTGYASAGLLLSGNVFEWFMPFLPLYAANTVNEFDADYTLKRISVRPSYAVKFTVGKVKDWMSQHGLIARRAQNSCIAIF
jgi:hypothetical protein